MMAFSGVTSQCEERGFRRSAGTNFEIAIAVVPAGTKCFSLLRKTTGRWSVNHAFSLPHWNSVPSTQMQCRTTASLRATAVLAFLMPTRLASRTPQAFKTDHRFTTLSRTLAASRTGRTWLGDLLFSRCGPFDPIHQTGNDVVSVQDKHRHRWNS